MDTFRKRIRDDLIKNRVIYEPNLTDTDLILEDKMAIEIKVKLQRMRVPNYVLIEPRPGTREEGLKETPKYSLSELDAATLDELCIEFRREVFLKASKPDPAL